MRRLRTILPNKIAARKPLAMAMPSVLSEPVPLRPDELRVVTPDVNAIYKTRTENDVADFVYDPYDKKSPDDSVMIIRNGLHRFKRIVKDHVNLQWFKDQFETTETALIAAFNYAKNNKESITLYIPKGVHRIYSTVEFDFGINVTVNLIGEAVSGRNSGSTFLWSGEQGGTMFRFRSMFMSRFENLDFIGRDGNAMPAKYLIHFEWVAGGLTTLLTFRKCTFGGVGGDESACVNMNATGPLAITSKQVDESTFEDCFFAGSGWGVAAPLQSWYAVLIGGNNTKNFTFRHNHMIGFSEAIIKGLSGIGQLRSFGNITGGSAIHFDLTAVTTLTSIADYTEGNGMLLRTGIGSTGWSSYTLIGYENHSGNYDGAIKEFPTNHEYVIEGQGNLLIQGCTFNSGKFQAKINWIMENGIQGLTSMNCNFFGVTNKDLTPFYSSGTPLFKSKKTVHRVISLNNTGINADGISVYGIPNKI